ncbi:MAG: REDY-like protein HapK [Pseudomonadota bacterium]
MPNTVVVLFNLKPGVAGADYEAWAKTRDLPNVRAMSQCQRFDVFRSIGVFGSDAPAPYQYVEIIDVADLATFRGEAGSETMQSVVAEFQELADAPLFIVTENIEA